MLKKRRTNSGKGSEVPPGTNALHTGLGAYLFRGDRLDALVDSKITNDFEEARPTSPLTPAKKAGKACLFGHGVNNCLGAVWNVTRPFLLSGLLFAESQEDPMALLIQGRALQRRGGGEDPAAAVQMFRKVVALEPKSAEAHLRLSEALLESGNLDAALVAARQSTQLAPRNGEAWAHLGILEQANARKNPVALANAKTALQTAADLMPGDPELWTRLAEISEHMQDEESAIKAWVRVGRLRPMFTIQGKSLGDIAWERVVSLGEKLNRYELRREAIMALCNRQSPDNRHLGLLEDLAREQADKSFLGHAEESFTLLGRHLSDVPALWENIALLQLRTSRFEEALQTLLKAEGLRRSPRISFYIGSCLMNLGRLKESEARWQEVIQGGIGPGNPSASQSNPASSQEEQRLQKDAVQLLGTVYLLQRRPVELLSLVAKEEDVPAKPELLSFKTLALLQMGNQKQALQWLKLGMARHPEKGIFHLAKSYPPKHVEDSLFNKKRIAKTLMVLELDMMASLNADFRRWQSCLDLLMKARKIEPIRSIDMVLLHGSALQELGRLKEAIDVLRQGQEQDPDHPMLQNNLGYLLLEWGGDLQEAARLIEDSMKKDPENGSTMDSWGWALYKLGRYPEAEQALLKAAQLSPLSPETRMHLGEVLLKLDRPEDALEQWERALAFAFPDRKSLEEKVRSLRIQVAKRKRDARQEGDVAEPLSDEDLESIEEPL